MTREENDAPKPAAPPPGRRWRRAAAWSAALLVVLFAATGTALWWLVRSDEGARWALQRVPGLVIEGQRGRPTGGPFAAERVRLEAGGWRIVVEGLAWQDARWRWRPYPGAYVGVTLVQPRAQRVVATPPPPDDEPKRPPPDLRLPLELAAQGLEVGTLQIAEQPPLTELRGDVHLGAERGARHRLERIALVRDTIAANADLVVAADGEMAVRGRVQAAARPGAPRGWRAEAALDGPLARLRVEGRVQVDPGATANVQATLVPFASWPIAALTAEAHEIDLAAFAATLPQTSLSGRAVLAEGGAGVPLKIDVEATNAAAGAWNAGKLPLRRLQTTLRARADDPARLDFEALAAELGGTTAAGTVRGAGRWHGSELQVQAQLEGVQPAALDARAAPLELRGDVKLVLRGVPAPPGAAASAPAAGTAAPAPVPRAAAPASVPRAAASASASASDAAAPAPPRGAAAQLPAPGAAAPLPAPPGGLAGELQVDLAGRLLQRGAPPVALAGEASFAAPADRTLDLRVSSLQAKSGAARLAARLHAERGAGEAWRVRSDGELANFDPATWWPGLAGSGRAAPSALNGRWNADLRWRTPAPDGLLAALRGDASLTFDDSRYAGVPLRGSAAIEARDESFGVAADVRAGANRLQLDGDAGVGARTPRWRVDVAAPALGELAPLRTLLPRGAAGHVPQSGALHAQARAAGRWPGLSSEGRLRIDAWRSPALQAQRAAAQWTFGGLRSDAPLTLELNAQGLAHGGRRVERLQATLRGTARAHELRVAAASPLRPPEWAEAIAGSTPPGGSTLQLALRGAWADGAGRGGTWRATLAEATAAPRARPTSPWLAARDLAARVELDAAARPQSAELAPGRIALFGGAVRWREARWRAGTPARFAVDAELEPLAAAPLLARLQPQFGWSGDLTVGARAVVRREDRFDADVVVERRGGDLGFVLDGERRTLGLQALRVGFAAHGGRWRFTQSLAGSQVGVLEGEQTVTAAAGTAWPGDTAPLQGRLGLRLADLGHWTPWLPLGWRVGGTLAADVALSGRFGAPEYRGRIAGERLMVRNLFEGVHLRDGTLAVALVGREATIEQAVFRSSGDGTLRVRGGASFGSSPRASLHAEAVAFRALDRVDRRVAVSGTAELTLQEKRIALRGRFAVDRGLVDVSQADAPQLDDDVIIVRAPRSATRPAAAGQAVPASARMPAPAPQRAGTAASAGVPGAAATAPRPDAATAPRPAAAAAPQPAAETAPSRARMPADVHLTVDLGERLRLRGRGIDTLLRGRLVVATNKDGVLAVHGDVSAAEGKYTAYGQNLAIERGLISFAGDVANPRLDILALRADVDQRVGVVVIGTAANPRVRLYSEPELPEFDTLTWLVLGRAPEGLGRDDTALLQRAALALLAGQRGGGGGFVQKLGLDELSFKRAESGRLADTVLTLGKQVSKRLYVGYEKALSAAGGSWQLVYRVAGRFTVRLQAGEDNALDAIWRWRWD